jgi:aquaporin Z
VSTGHSVRTGRAGKVAAPQQPTGGWHFADWLSELAGTAILIFGGLSAVVLDFYLGSPMARLVPSHSLRLLITGALFAGAGAAVTVSPLGRRSGAHLNPSVTLAFRLTGHVHPHDVAGYWAAQFTGALLGTVVLRLAWGGRAAALRYGVTEPGAHVGAIAALAIEAGMTAALVLVLFAFLSSPRTVRWTPAAAWLLITLEVWQGAPLTGTSLNPARSMGPATVASYYANLWIYFIAPLAGAAAAAVAWRWVPREVLTAKLFHDPRYRSPFGSRLPVRRS